MKQKQPGFGILEALITLAIVITVASVITSNMMRDRTTQDLAEIEYFSNRMLATARHESASKHCAMRLHFYANATPHKIILEQEVANAEIPGTKKFIPSASIGGKNSFIFPTTWIIKAIYNGPNELLSENKNTATCTLEPSGILPSQLIHLHATQKKQGATLKTEPFLKTFTLHNQLITPPKKKSKNG